MRDVDSSSTPGRAVSIAIARLKASGGDYVLSQTDTD